MALFGSNKGYAKKDINFFASFTANARRQTQILAVVVFIGIIAIGVSLALTAYKWFRNSGVKKDIDNLNKTLASEEYAGLELKSQSLQQEINEKNQYYYTLTEMRRIVNQHNPADTAIVDLIGANIPSSAYVDSYTLSGNNLSISGTTFSYYDAANICYMLNQNDVFTSYVSPNVQRDNSLAQNPESADNPIDNYYDFTITGNLTADYIVSICHYATTETGVIALGGVDSQVVEANASFEYTDVSTYSANGINYTLNSVTINNVTVSPEEFAIIQANNKVSGIASGNVEIELYYIVAAEPAAEEEVAE
ncbi:MAG: PilN domain-containing protein [Saccharofermentans sp.]|nr:PilN domain-containing protein [Saccharofermentans sp.]